MSNILAFPRPCVFAADGELMDAGEHGMSLRDYFAGQALACMDGDELYYGSVEKPNNPWPWLAKQCYDAADAMLAAREAKP